MKIAWLLQKGLTNAVLQQMESASLMSPALAGVFFTTSAMWEAPKASSEVNQIAHPLWPGIVFP